MQCHEKALFFKRYLDAEIFKNNIDEIIPIKLGKYMIGQSRKFCRDSLVEQLSEIFIITIIDIAKAICFPKPNLLQFPIKSVENPNIAATKQNIGL